MSGQDWFGPEAGKGMLYALDNIETESVTNALKITYVFYSASELE